MSDEQRPFFFVHIMKTAGSTFREYIYKNFPEGTVYPEPFSEGLIVKNTVIKRILELPAAEHAATRAYTGHFPYVVSQMLPSDPITMTILRDPVARTLSYLKHAKREHKQHRDLTLEEIYDDGFYNPCFIKNHQVKMFAMDQDDKLESYMDVIDIDDRRLETAKENLLAVDAVGFAEDFEGFCRLVTERFGWGFDHWVEDQRVSKPADVPDGLEDRIREENAADVEFYEFARSHFSTPE